MVEEIQAELINGTTERFQIDDSSLIIPTSIDRFGLSKMINDLLKLDEPVVFDILFKDQPLRCVLAEKLEQYNIKSETTIKLVYVLAITEPLETEVDSLNEWISDLSFDNSVLSLCCYDGKITIYNADDMMRSMSFFNRSKSASAIHMYNSNLTTYFELICAGVNGLIEVYKVDISEEHSEYSLLATTGRGSDTVTSLATDATGSVILAGGYNNNISIYENRELLLNISDECDINNRKRTLDMINTLPLVHNLKIHSKSITGLEFLISKEGIFISSSLDGTLLIWDLNEKTCLSQYNTGKPVTCFSVSPYGSQIATGHNEGGVAIWDIRCKDSKDFYLGSSDFTGSKLNNVSSNVIHNKSVGCIAWNPSRVDIIASFGFDGNVFLTDIRSPKIPLQMTKFEFDGERDRGTRCSWISTNDLVCTTASGVIKKLHYEQISR